MITIFSADYPATHRPMVKGVILSKKPIISANYISTAYSNFGLENNRCTSFLSTGEYYITLYDVVVCVHVHVFVYSCAHVLQCC